LVDQKCLKTFSKILNWIVVVRITRTKSTTLRTYLIISFNTSIKRHS
jgi:hypothetical protein